MSRILFLPPVVALTMLFLSGCTSIFEERSDCPCYVTLDLSRTNPSIERLELWFFSSDGKLLAMDTLYSEEYKAPYNIELKRGMIGCHIWGNFNTDSLYYGAGSLDATGESLYKEVEVCKEYAEITLTLNGGEGDGCLSSRISCPTSGREIDGRFIEREKTIEGEKSFDSKGNLLFRYRIIRQNSMERMKLLMSRYSPQGAEVVESLELGVLLSGIGYDMESKNLKDIVISMDMSFTSLKIVVEPWDEKESDIIII